MGFSDANVSMESLQTKPEQALPGRVCRVDCLPVEPNQNQERVMPKHSLRSPLLAIALTVSLSGAAMAGPSITFSRFIK